MRLAEEPVPVKGAVHRCTALPLTGTAFSAMGVFKQSNRLGCYRHALVFLLAVVDAVSLPHPNGGPVSGRNSQMQPAARGGSWEEYSAFSF